ncbi:hypothetical protein BJV78DRAFT_1152227 [Lactifluus subvellereus]|nr:hypothetical protein BJV78DRAFT_1152227 [Lactifluus subvellereus]
MLALDAVLRLHSLPSSLLAGFGVLPSCVRQSGSRSRLRRELLGRGSRHGSEGAGGEPWVDESIGSSQEVIGQDASRRPGRSLPEVGRVFRVSLNLTQTIVHSLMASAFGSQGKGQNLPGGES